MNSRLLNLDIEDFAAYNDHGAALVSALRRSEIATSHYPVILGMFAVWSLLVSIGHISEDEVLWPPYASEQFKAQAWLNGGLTPTVVAIIALLPYHRMDYRSRDYRFHMDPEALLTSYLGSPAYETSEERPGGYLSQRDIGALGRDLIKADHVRLTEGWIDGTNYIYDTASGKIVMLNMDDYKYDGTQLFGTSYTARQDQFFPAHDIMRNWISNLLDLVYIPYPLAGERPMFTMFMGMEYDRKTEARLHPSHEELTAYCNDVSYIAPPFFYEDQVDLHLTDRRRAANLVITLRKIYRDFGWPDNFDKAGCRKALETFVAENDRFETKAAHASAFERHDRRSREEKPIREAQDIFLQGTAGEFAILPHMNSRDEL